MKSLKSREPARLGEAALPARTSTSEVPSNHAAEPIDAHEIGKSAWSEFCGWLTKNLGGVRTTIIRDEEDDTRKVDCLDRPLERIEAVVLPNGVNAIKVTVQMNGKSHFFEVAGPAWLRVHYDAAGLVTAVQIGYGDGKLTLRFSGPLAPGVVFTANSWGE